MKKVHMCLNMLASTKEPRKEAGTWKCLQRTWQWSEQDGPVGDGD